MRIEPTNSTAYPQKIEMNLKVHNEGMIRTRRNNSHFWGNPYNNDDIHIRIEIPNEDIDPKLIKETLSDAFQRVLGCFC